ncbi:hypothetical protein F5884DRAFT_848043 [Xylogone sp. PMI_703]|nr:hypothetical protein F5884DRAFT_848043 [Xylogone sp. PMI_703]
MPFSKPRPLDVPVTSYLCYSELMVYFPLQQLRRCRFVFFLRDPINVALDWAVSETVLIPVIMSANETRPGGDWEAGIMSPEEYLCRRSNLYATLTTSAPGNSTLSNYSIPPKAGIFSEHVVVFRSGPQNYEVWQEYKALPIISVPPVKRPKLSERGTYSFAQEKELMRENIRTALRIAVYYGYPNLCISSFGLGPGFRNPPEEVSTMWRNAFLEDPEFVGWFGNIVFAFDPVGEGSKSPPSSKTKSSSSNGKEKSIATGDLEVFKHIFKPAVIHNAFKS